MRKYVLICWFALLLASSSSSIYANINAARASDHYQDSKVKIKKEELPEAARKTLEGDAFKGWSVTSASKTKEEEYEVELKKGDTTQTIKFDKEGKLKS